MMDQPAPTGTPANRFWFWIDEERPTPMIRDIQRAAVEYFGGNMHELLSNSQRNQIVLSRYVGMYLSRRLTKHTMTGIGRAFRRDHTIVVAADRKIKRLIGDDPDFASRVAQVETQFA